MVNIAGYALPAKFSAGIFSSAPAAMDVIPPGKRCAVYRALPYRAGRGENQLAAPFAPDAGPLGASRGQRGISGGKFAPPLSEFVCRDAQPCGHSCRVSHGRK